jgi:large subunit ribosomal protein L18
MGSNKIEKRIKREKHSRKNLFGSTERPRLTVYRSNTHIYAQIVDDSTHKTIAAASDIKVKEKKNPIEKASAVGKEIGEKAIKMNIKSIVFDRGGYKYHGRVKALADGAREAGLVF